MRDNIFTRTFNRLPRAFAWTLVLVVLTEAFVYSNREWLVHDYWNKFIINEHHLLEAPGDYDYLILGNSVQKTGIRVKEVGEHLVCLGLAGAKPMAQYVLLKRYLRHHKPPKVIFFMVDPENQYDSMQVITRYFFDAGEFWEHIEELDRDEREAYLGKLFATLDHRKVGLSEDRVRYPGSNAAFVRELVSNRGYMPSPFHDRKLAGDFYAKNQTHRRIQSGITVSARDRRYFDRIMQLAREKRILVVFLGMVVPKELYGIFDGNGFFAEYGKYLQELQEKYPNAVLAGEPQMFLEHRYFSDFQHLNDEGSLYYTDFFKKNVFEPAVAAVEGR